MIVDFIESMNNWFDVKNSHIPVISPEISCSFGIDNKKQEKVL